MQDGLVPSATGLFLLQDTNLGGLALHDHHVQGNRERHTGNDDGKGAERPAEVEIIVEQVCNFGASEGAGNCGRTVDAEHDHAVFQRGHVGEHDINHIHHANVSGPVKGMRAKVCLDVLAGSFHDHADNDNQQHENEARNPTPDVDNFGKRESRTTTENGRYDANTGKETM